MKGIDGRYEKALSVAEETGEMVEKMQFENFGIGYKSGLLDPVTDIDRSAQKKIYDSIKLSFPDDNFLGEESGYDKMPVNAETLWIVDPIDGTANFIHGLPFWCVSIAFYNSGIPVFGVVYAPVMNQMFSARKNSGAFLNGRKLSVSNIMKLSESCISTGLTDLVRKGRSEIPGKVVSESFKSAQRVRLIGTAALQICYVAAGWMEGFFETSLKPWDVAAALLIAEEAGGRTSDMSGGKYRLNRSDIVVSNGRMHEALIEMIRRNIEVVDK